jgi:hypothetical protein
MKMNWQLRQITCRHYLLSTHDIRNYENKKEFMAELQNNFVNIQVSVIQTWHF